MLKFVEASVVDAYAAATSDIAASVVAVAICLRLVMRTELILLATLALLNVEMTSAVYYEAKDPYFHLRVLKVSDGTEGPLGLLKLVLEAFFGT